MKVSIVVPVYNKGPFVERCLIGALSQDFDDYEVIAVDDGSTDDSGHVCDEMAKGNSMLRVIHTANRGVTAARRRGVEEARSTYIMFCDSDDELLPHALRNSYNAMIEHQADEVIAPYQNQRGDLFDSGRRGIVAANDIIKDFLATRNSFPPNCAILFRRDWLMSCLDIPREITMGEDILFHITYLVKQPKVLCIDGSNYIYNQGVSSSCLSKLETEKLYDEQLRKALAPQWEELKPWFVLHQLKCYERFINQRDFYVKEAYYKNVKSDISNIIPLADRIAFSLPPRLAYILIHYYKKWKESKSKRITDYYQ